MIQIIPLKPEHLEEAAVLVSNRYQELRAQVPLLPSSYSEVNTLMPHLKEILNNSRDGVAAIHGGRLVGFLTAWILPSFRGRRSVYSPEWANAADLNNSSRIYEEMYSHLASNWVADKCTAHYISLFPVDTKALKAWHWLGFGMISIDAICGLDILQDVNEDFLIRRAGLEDLGDVIELHEALRHYMEESPIFLPTEKKDQNYFEEWLRNPDKVVWLAYQNNKPVAILRLGPADDDVCTIIQEEKTTSIYAAYTKEQAREKGIGTAMLSKALNAAEDMGYERCAVSFEPMNLIGTHFWFKYFTPVCYSLVRHLDSRLIQD